MDFIFCKLKNLKKNDIIFASLKNLKKYVFDFLASLKKFKKRDFDFILLQACIKYFAS
eukprot:UN24361